MVYVQSGSGGKITINARNINISEIDIIPGLKLQGLCQKHCSTIRTQIGSFSCRTHIASHGQFSSKAEDTFILTWDGRININQLDSLLRSSDRSKVIELLVLSACRTVAGDKRAALGLAGVAVRAGARSTLASLWQINDAATVPFMSRFYRELARTTVTKAEAVRRAQLTLLQNPQYRHPVYWAAYVLVGNWL